MLKSLRAKSALIASKSKTFCSSFTWSSTHGNTSTLKPGASSCVAAFVRSTSGRSLHSLYEVIFVVFS